ncbi:MAG: GTPase Era [Gemmatimonadota bacterium]
MRRADVSGFLMPHADDDFRAGFVALLGLPNAGKSTLLNALIGERLSIVTRKAQTTRQRILGIHSDEGHQAIFIDTPGLLEPTSLFQRSMRQESERAVTEAEVVVLVADATNPGALEHADGWVPPRGPDAILCLNKVRGLAAGRRAVLRARFGRARSRTAVFFTDALSGEGVEELRRAILSRLPASPPYYPPDDLATAPVRFFVAELIRETCLDRLSQEIPYSLAVRVEAFRENESPVYIGATLFVERASQKGIVIGKGGRTIREIGSRARGKIERLLELRVYLDLRVKVLRNWRQDAAKLKLLGYSTPENR